MERKQYIKKARRIVVKVGTSIITTNTGQIDNLKLANIVKQLASLQEQGFKVILVSSGAIAAGIEALGLKSIPKTIPELQASAAVGQGLLIRQYSELFKQKNINVGQVLLTQADTTYRQQYVNAKNTLNKLLELKVIPIINENDSTAIDEIKLGDNDTLGALVANITEADLLVILSDVDGLFDADPKTSDAKLISIVKEIDRVIESHAGGSGTVFGRGGMETKIRAAKMATAGQTGVVIANGHKKNILAKIFDGQVTGTFFIPQTKKISARKLWILNQPIKGSILIDKGAAKAIIEGGKSLLAAGIIGFRGDFSTGDIIAITADIEGDQTIKGITNYSSQEINIIAGKKYDEIINLINTDSAEEVVHRDDMTISISRKNKQC